MAGVIVCTHSTFAEGVHNAVEMIVGEQENFDFVCFREGEDVLALSERIKAVVEKYTAVGERFVVCVDMFGATPFNASAIALADTDASVITEVNLPMLLHLVTERDSGDDYDAWIQGALESATNNMKVVKMKEMFGQ